MKRDELIQLTNVVYRLTLLFPKKEPLRYKIREVADDILAKPQEKDLENINSFFEVAKNQNWVSPDQILAIQKEYDNLRRGLKEERENPSVIRTAALEEIREEPQNSLIERQERILAFLRENGRVQVGQLVQMFPEVTKRTLRRDFENMLQRGLVERIGERNDTFYQIKVEKA